MPHKHKRKRGQDDDSTYDLPPTSRAKALPAYHSKSSTNNNPTKKNNKRQKIQNANTSSAAGGADYKIDDTPRAFKRLMAFQQKLQEGKQRSSSKNSEPIITLTNHGSQQKKKKLNKKTLQPNHSTTTTKSHSAAPVVEQQTLSSSTTTTTPKHQEVPKILPGESLRDFSARVDALLPLSLSSTKTSAAAGAPSSKTIARELGLKERTTLHNKRLQKMIEGWREEEEKIKERKREQLDEEEEDGGDDDHERLETGRLWRQAGMANANRKGKKVRAKKRRGGAGDDGGSGGSEGEDEEGGDPFAAFTKKKLEETRQRSLQDVVQAPPQLVLKDGKRGLGKVKLKDYGPPRASDGGVHGRAGKEHRRGRR